MTWVRIDKDRPLRNPVRKPGERTFGWEGELWPRLMIGVSFTRDEILNGPSWDAVLLTCQTKTGPGRWWYRADPPPGLVALFPALLEERQAWVDSLEQERLAWIDSLEKLRVLGLGET